MYSDIDSADGIIISSPIYMAVFAQAADNEDFCSNLFESLKMRSKFFGWELIDNILACGTENPGYIIPQELLDRAFTDGKKFV